MTKMAFAGVAFALVLGLTSCERDRNFTRMNVLLVTFDTTRADFIGAYGRKDAFTPTLDGMAENGYLFEHAISSNPVTQAAHSTILTGTYPMAHGVRDNGLFKLPEESETLAELLKQHGYRTGAAVGGFPLVKSFGLNQGFDFYDDDLVQSRQDHRGRPAQRDRNTWYDERPAGNVNDAILPWLRASSDEPFFAWIHYWDPHLPHIAPEPYGKSFAHEPYLGEIAYADQSLGVILKDLESRGLLKNTIIVMTSDHGESRYQHKEDTHAFLAYDTTLHVPLIFRVPGKHGGRRIVERVGTVDIVPTVMDLLGFPLPEFLQGRSLQVLMDEPEGGDVTNRRQYYAESMSPKLTHNFGELRALYWGPYKYIHGPRPEMFNLADDPGEIKDLSGSGADESARMKPALGDFIQSHARTSAGSATHEFDESVRRRLAALGYLSTSDSGGQSINEVLDSSGLAPQERVNDINLQQQLRSLMGRGAWQAAEKTLRRLMKGAPEHAYFQAQLANVFLGTEDLDSAARLVDETGEIRTGHTEAYIRVARALYESGNRDRATAMLRRVNNAQPTAAGELELARMYRDDENSDAYGKALERALGIDETHLGARVEWTRYLLELEDFHDAEKALLGMLAETPIQIDVNLAYGRYLAAVANTQGAREHLARTQLFWPGSCDVFLERIGLMDPSREKEIRRQLREEAENVCRGEAGRRALADVFEGKK